MRKYLYTIKIAADNLMAYPSRFFLPLWGAVIIFVFSLYLWINIYNQETEIAGLTLPMVITYYAVLFTFRKLVESASIARTIETDVHSGELSKYLLKNLDYTLFNFYYLNTQKLLQFVPSLALLVLATIAYPTIVSPPQNLSLFLVAIILGMLINFLTYAVLGTMAFWIIKTWGIRQLIDKAITILSGAVIPLAFLPSWLQFVTDVLPFKYMVYTPISAYTGADSTSEVVVNIRNAAFWICFLLLLYIVTWKKGLAKYDSAGN